MTGDVTPHPEVNALLEQVLAEAQSVLGPRFLGMYVEGSLANGDFDQDSDIDFVVVTAQPVGEADFQALQAVHRRLSALDTPWAIQLEGFYVGKEQLRRYDPALDGPCPNIERGSGERLKLVHLGPTWDVHRWVLRERGIVLAGPQPRALIDPVAPEQLRQVMRSALEGWAAQVQDEPDWQAWRGAQSYVVLTICRILYTLQTGAVASKPTAARWVQQTLDARWSPLIERAWYGRRHPGQPAEAQDVAQTLEMVRWAVERYQNASTA